MSYNLSAFAGAGAQFFDNSGVPLTGGLIYTYLAGTTTPADTWTNNSGAVLNANPIVLDSAGRTANEIWLNSSNLYKFVLKTSTGVTIGTYDNVPAINDPTVFNNLITVTGSNALIGTSSPPYTGYTAGMTLSFVAANNNTGAVTIDLDGLGVKDIYADSVTPLTSGAIKAGKIVSIEYDGSRFQVVGGTAKSGGATGGGDDAVFYENGQTVTTSYTITANKNAMSAGPIVVNSGVVVTVPTGARWTVV